MASQGPARVLIPLLFLVSGATGLVYEVAWTREFSVVFGATALAVSSVLAAFMAGLAIGSRIFGARADARGDELRTYGILEIGVGIAALLLLPALDAVQHVFVAIHRTFHPPFWAMSLVRFAISFVLLVVPTALMGGTLPVLVRWWARAGDEAGKSLGRLYAVNTLGAMAGCMAGGFWMIEAFGVRRTILLTAIANGIVGAVAVALGGRRGREDAPAAATPAPAPAAAPAPADGSMRLALVAIGVSGFLALAYEVAWTRVLLFVLSASIHAFTIMLTTFLAGLALGSLVLSGRVARLRSALTVFGILEIGIGAAALGTVFLLAHYPQLHHELLRALRVHDWGDLVRVKFVEAALVVLLPTLLLGMTFPIVSQLYARGLPDLGRRVGTILAVNTSGAVLGSFASGFLLIPLLGTKGTIVLLAILNGALGGILLLGDAPRRGRRLALAVAPAAALAGLALLLPKDPFLGIFGINLPRGEVVYAREGITGTVTITEMQSSLQGGPPMKVLAINGADVAGTSLMLRTTQKLQAHIPLLLHPDPRQVLQVGLGSGETAHSILLHPIERLTGCDLSPEVIEAGAEFDEINRTVYSDPRLSIVIEDAKNFVECTDRTFDLILNDSVHPIFRGSADLYAREYFEACRARLRPGGMMSSWFPIGLIGADDLRMLLRTFQEVFPTSTVWVATNAVTRNALLLGWKDEPKPRIDLARINRILRDHPDIAADLAEVGFHTVPSLLDAFMLDPAALAELTKGARVNTFDHPYLEFSAPRVTARGDLAVFATNFELLTSHRAPLLPYLVNLGETPDREARVRERFEQRARASAALIRGLQAEVEGRSDAAQEAYREALEVLPGDPLTRGFVERDRLLREGIGERVANGTASLGDYVQAARWHKEAGDPDAAVETLRQAIERQPDLLQPRVEILPLLLQTGEVEDARRQTDRILEIDGRMIEVYAVRGRLKLMAGDSTGAVADLTRAADEGAKLPWAEVMLARLLRAQGREDDARSHLERAIEWEPDGPDAAEAREMLAPR